MTEDQPEKGTPHEQEPPREGASGEQTAEAKRYARMAAENPERIHGKQARLTELLQASDESEPIESRVERRAAASSALLRLAGDDSTAIRECIEEILEELQREHNREMPSVGARTQAMSRDVIDTLVQAVALVIVEQPDTVTEISDLSAYTSTITTDLETETLRIAAKAFFASGSEVQRPGPAVETLAELIDYPDDAVQAWGAGALGQLASAYPDEVAAVADDLRSLTSHDDATVQHNTVEALGVLVRTHPESVVPATDALRELLTHDEAGIQHNATGVLGRLAETHPDAVVPAIDDLKALCAHEDEAVQRIATGALARLTRERPEAIGDG